MEEIISATSKIIRIANSFQKEDPLDIKDAISELLGWSVVDEYTYPRRALYVDFLYQLLEHSLSKGLPLNALPFVFQLGTEMLDQLRFSEAPLREDLSAFLSNRITSIFGSRKLLEEAPGVTSRMLAALSEFFEETVLSHASLYHHCLTSERELQLGSRLLEVQVPPLPPRNVPVAPDPPRPEQRLSQAQEYRLWKYEEDLRQIQRHTERFKQVQKETLDQLVAQNASLIEREVLEALEISYEEPFNKKAVQSLIGRITKLKTEELVSLMKHDMAIFEEEMGDMIDRTGLPRPPEKGAPDRFKPKSTNETFTEALGKATARGPAGRGATQVAEGAGEKTMAKDKEKEQRTRSGQGSARSPTGRSPTGRSPNSLTPSSGKRSSAKA